VFVGVGDGTVEAGWQEESKTNNVRQKKRRIWRMGKLRQMKCLFESLAFWKNKIFQTS
jgi:hypothetical protein